MNYHDAKVQARAMSIDDQCTQYVNRRLDMSYYTSDWYNGDACVITYTKGELQFVSSDDITRVEEDIDSAYADVLVLDTSKPYVEVDISDLYACHCGCEDDAEMHRIIRNRRMHLV